MVAVVALDPPANAVMEVDAAGINPTDPLTSHSPSVRVIEVTLAASVLVRDTALPEATEDDR
jgi:hypothetical protein